jgi:hypothetical protein
MLSIRRLHIRLQFSAYPVRASGRFEPALYQGWRRTCVMSISDNPTFHMTDMVRSLVYIDLTIAHPVDKKLNIC